MRWDVFAAELVATLAVTSPVQVTQDETGLEWISNDLSLPKVVLYDTGGTILATSNYSRLDNINYGSGPGLTALDLIGNYSEVLSVAQLAVVSFAAHEGSTSFNSSLFLNISRAANLHLCAPGSDIAGAVLLHGTNTVEDTIFGLDLTVNCSKPIVATGAMRPESYMSKDGPSNFYQAVAVAADPRARDRGALIALNDRIVSAFYGVKTNANSVDTFRALEQGSLGAMLGGQPYWYYAPAYPTARHHYDLSKLEPGAELPAVVVLFGHQGFDSGLMYAAVGHGAKGIVIMGAGAGQLSDTALTAAADLKKRGIPVVASLRPYAGASPPKPYVGDYITSGFMDAGKARIQLQLCLATGMGWDGCQEVFERDTREAIYNQRTMYYYT